MQYIYSSLLLAIVGLMSVHTASAQTNFTQLFETPEYKSYCSGLSPETKFCYSPLTIVHESNSSIIAGVLEGGMTVIGPELDLLTKAGYKVQSFVPDVNDAALHYEQWVYLTKP